MATLQTKWRFKEEPFRCGLCGKAREQTLPALELVKAGNEVVLGDVCAQCAFDLEGRIRSRIDSFQSAQEKLESILEQRQWKLPETSDLKEEMLKERVKRDSRRDEGGWVVI